MTAVQLSRARPRSLPRSLHVHLPLDRGAGDAAEEALRVHHQLLRVWRMLLHPGLAGCDPVVAGIADSNEAVARKIIQRGQARSPGLIRRIGYRVGPRK